MADDIVELHHAASGARAKIHKFGATVIDFVTSEGRQVLFVSSTAKLDSTKAIRGGIPLVFPVFGPAPDNMPQHGFLRNNTWTLLSADGASCRLQLDLKNVVAGRGDGAWSVEDPKYNCVAILDVAVEASKLTNKLTIRNTGSSKFDMQTLFHTYYRVADEQAFDSKQCNVTGLQGYQVHDKITDAKYTLGSEPLFLEGNVDRVYTPETVEDLCVEIATGNDTKCKLTASGSVDGEKVKVSAVVWNPHREKAAAMSDFATEEFVDMICVEPGLLADVPPCSNECIFEQVIEAI